MGLAGATDRLETSDRWPMEDNAAVRDQDPRHDHDRDPICLGATMAPGERSAYLEHLHLARIDQERARIREQHRLEINVRAKERGISPSSKSKGSGSALKGNQQLNGHSSDKRGKVMRPPETGIRVRQWAQPGHLGDCANSGFQMPLNLARFGYRASDGLGETSPATSRRTLELPSLG